METRKAARATTRLIRRPRVVLRGEPRSGKSSWRPTTYAAEPAPKIKPSTRGCAHRSATNAAVARVAARADSISRAVIRRTRRPGLRTAVPSCRIDPVRQAGRAGFARSHRSEPPSVTSRGGQPGPVPPARAARRGTPGVSSMVSLNLTRTESGPPGRMNVGARGCFHLVPVARGRQVRRRRTPRSSCRAQRDRCCGSASPIAPGCRPAGRPTASAWAAR